MYKWITHLWFIASKDIPSLESYLHHIDGEGSSALHMAVLNCHINNVKTLIEAGANVNYTKVGVRCQCSIH